MLRFARNDGVEASNDATSVIASKAKQSRLFNLSNTRLIVANLQRESLTVLEITL
ncbi:MAG: hypothetical protein WCG04_01205 [Alphaproteobacteria bacterium]